MKLEYIQDWESIFSETFQQNWKDWYANVHEPHVFFHPELCMAWLETYRSIRDLSPVFCIGRHGEQLFFLPLLVWKRNWKNAFQKLVIPLGYADFDYHDPIAVNTSPEMVEEFLKVLLIELPLKVAYDQLELNGLRSNFPSLPMEKENDIAPFAELFRFTNLDEAKSLLSTRLKGDIRRQSRRIMEMGTMEFRVIEDQEEALDLLPEFLAHHQSKWPNAYKAPNFHKNLIKFGLLSGVTHFSVLTVDRKIISYHLGFMTSDRYYYYMPAYDNNCERYSPGKVHLYLLFEYAFQAGCKVFDHLRGSENYKSGWTDQVQELYSLTYTSSLSSSKVKAVALKLKTTFKK